MKKILNLSFGAIFLTQITNLAQSQNAPLITYYDANWNRCDKKVAVYIGTKTLIWGWEDSSNHFSDQSAYKIEDYYITGELQCTGTEIFNPNFMINIRHGIWNWYSKDGKNTKTKTYDWGKIVNETIPTSSNKQTAKPKKQTGKASVPKYRKAQCKHYKQCTHIKHCQHLITCQHPIPCYCVCRNNWGVLYPCHTNHGFMHLNDGYRHLNDGVLHLNDGLEHDFDWEQY